jgi:hypothetical protein
MKKPRYKAYKPVLATDGVKCWTRHTFDDTVKWTNDDCEKFAEVFSAKGVSPIGSIEIMQERLAALENITPTIQLHVDAIRQIHAVFFATKPITLDSLAALDKQNEHWRSIWLIQDVLPVVRESVAQKAKRKAVNTANSIQPRPNARTDEIKDEFKRLVKDGHTPGQARGILLGRGLASKSTIWRHTKKIMVH